MCYFYLKTELATMNIEQNSIRYIQPDIFTSFLYTSKQKLT